MVKTKKALIGAAVLAAAGVPIVAGYEVFRRVLVRKPYYKSEYNKPYKQEYFDSIEWYNARPKISFEAKSYDGLALFGELLPAKKPTKKLAVAVHGYKGEGCHMSFVARMYHEMGYDVLVPDLRASGRSEGRYIGMGNPDQIDLLVWLHQMLKFKGSDCRVVLHGVSMGAATVLLASALPALPKNVKCIVEDCGYTNAYAEMLHVMQTRYKGAPRAALELVNAYCKAFAGYSLKSTSPVDAVKKSALPTLFIHGEQDKFVPYAMGKQLYNAKTQGCKEFLSVPDAVHAIAYFYNPERYIEAVWQFCEKHV